MTTKVMCPTPDDSGAISRMRVYDAAAMMASEGIIRDVSLGWPGGGLAHPAADAAIAFVSMVRASLSRSEVFVPIHTVSESNSRSHAAAGKYQRSKSQRLIVPTVLRTQTKKPTLPVRVTLVRHSVGVLDDGNLPSALKAVQDAVAMDYLGIDDADMRVIFRWEQVKVARGACGVTIRMECGF